MTWSEFKGSNEDRDRLLRAVSHNCECPKRPLGQAISPNEVCQAHRMLLDKGIIDHLLFSRFRRSQMLRQEFGVQIKRRF